MKANRLFTMLIIAAIIAVTGLTVREAVATSAVVAEVEAATHDDPDAFHRHGCSVDHVIGRSKRARS